MHMVINSFQRPTLSHILANVPLPFTRHTEKSTKSKRWVHCLLVEFAWELRGVFGTSLEHGCSSPTNAMHLLWSLSRSPQWKRKKVDYGDLFASTCSECPEGNWVIAPGLILRMEGFAAK